MVELQWINPNDSDYQEIILSYIYTETIENVTLAKNVQNYSSVLIPNTMIEAKLVARSCHADVCVDSVEETENFKTSKLLW